MFPHIVVRRRGRQEGRDPVVEEAQEVDGVQSLGEDEQGNDVARCLDPAVGGHGDGHRGQVDSRKDHLSSDDGPTSLCDVVQGRVEVDVQSRVDEWSGLTFDESIIPLTNQVLFYLLHIRLPVDFCVFDPQDDGGTEKCIDEKQSGTEVS